VDAATRRAVSFEALLRGPGGGPPTSVLDAVSSGQRAEFEAEARARAIRLAAHFGIGCQLNLNCVPSSFVHADETASSIRDIASQAGLRVGQIVLEITEQEAIGDRTAFLRSIRAYQRAGVRIAIDDFGAGHSGLNLLADLQPDSLKLDMHLIRAIHERGPRQAIVRAVVQACADLAIDVVAEGVECVPEYQCCRDLGIDLFQGFLFAKPGFECLPAPDFPGGVLADERSRRAAA
jgi:EAL domain-containing protein (putative c-di-GMP-specific phosphodiesterase class I)